VSRIIVISAMAHFHKVNEDFCLYGMGLTISVIRMHCNSFGINDLPGRPGAKKNMGIDRNKKSPEGISLMAFVYINPLLLGIESWLPSADSNHGQGG
jgi:hypothetical protein